MIKSDQRKVEREGTKMFLSTVLLQMKYPDEFDTTAGSIFISFAEEGAKLITNVHELVQFQKVLNNSIDACPVLINKDMTKALIETILYHKEV